LRRALSGESSPIGDPAFFPIEEGDVVMTWGEGRQPERRKPGGSFTGQSPQFHRRSDDKIREEIWELLTNNADLDASEVELHVESGEVTLTGTVDSRDARWLTEDLVTSVSGVREVNNRLKVAR
jgi:osmotically-inducible protein OsmY